MRRLRLSFLAGTTALLAQGNADSHREIPGFKIAGNLYWQNPGSPSK